MGLGVVAGQMVSNGSPPAPGALMVVRPARQLPWGCPEEEHRMGTHGIRQAERSAEIPLDPVTNVGRDLVAED